MAEVKKVSGKMQAAGGVIGATKAVLSNGVAAGGSSGESGSGSSTKAGPRNKEAAGVSTGVMTSMVTEESWIDYVILYKPDQELLAPKQERNDKPMEALVTKEMVPDSFIGILATRPPFKKIPPMTATCSELISKRSPVLHELYQKDMVRINCCIDLHSDVLRQYKKKGFAEVGVDFTSGVKMIFVLP